MIQVIHVDDEKHCLELTKEIMAYYDKELNIESFTSPKKVIESVREKEPDIILSDYKMPEMNGIEFTRQLRQYSSVPVILYTGKERNEWLKKHLRLVLRITLENPMTQLITLFFLNE